MRESALNFVAAGGIVGLPVVIPSDAPVEFWRWRPPVALKRGRWNILVPPEREPVRPEVLVVPLVGFDASRTDWGRAEDFTIGRWLRRSAGRGVRGRVPVVDGRMVKCRLRDSRSAARLGLEGDGDIKRGSRGPALADSDHLQNFLG